VSIRSFKAQGAIYWLAGTGSMAIFCASCSKHRSSRHCRERTHLRLFSHLLVPLISAQRTAASLVLSSFPKLTFLRIYLPHWIPSTQRLSMADQLFSGISPANVLRKIVVSADGGTLSMDSALCTQLDSQLSSLPMPHTPTVDLEVDQDSYEGISPYFPRLTSTNALRRTDSHGIAYWW